MTIGVVRRRQDVQRPYSVASAPRDAGDDGYEFYVRLVQGGTFTPLLWRLPVGHRMRMIGPKGKFLLEPDDDRTHLFISTGTGIAPFMAMMRQTLPTAGPARSWSSTAARTSTNSAIATSSRTGNATGRTRSPTCRRSRGRPIRPTPTGPGGPAGSSRSSRRPRGPRPAPAKSVVYICGNPDMILNAETVLIERGYAEYHVHKELYWPKGKVVPAVAG